MRRLFVLILVIAANAFVVANALGIDRETLKLMRQRPTIKAINLIGNEAFSDSEIRDKLYSKKRTFWQALKGERRGRLNRETLHRDTLEVKYLYLKDGFLGVRVTERFELNLEDRDSSSVFVHITVNEGKRYTLGPSSVRGDYQPEWQHQLERGLRDLKVGKPIDPFKIHRATFQMNAFLADRGYPRAMVRHFIDTANCQDSCPVIFEVHTDSLVRFGDVTVEGLAGYPDNVARRELKIKPGETYRQIDIVDTKRRLYESGYFTSYNLQETADSSNLYRPDFVLRVRERKAHFLTTTTGPVGQSDVDDLLWSFTFGFGKRNFLKTRQVSVAADYFFSTGSNAELRRNIYSFRYTDPWFLGIRMPTTFGFELRPKVRSEHEQEYDIASWAASVSTLKKFGRFIRTDFGFEYESVDITGIPEEDIPLIKQENRVSERRKMYFAFRRDSRDHLFIPKRGSVVDFSGQYIGGFLGGDDNFFSIEAGWSRYHVVWPGWISAFRVRGGWVRPFGESSVVPADDRLYLGGASSVRGFREKSLGPLSEDSIAIGARFMLLFNQEFRWKTFQILQKLPVIGKLFNNLPLYQSLFVDAGNGFNRVEDIRLDNFAYSWGTGIQMVSPAGPIRLDYARRITTDHYEFDSRWHFTILYAF